MVQRVTQRQFSRVVHSVINQKFVFSLRFPSFLPTHLTYKLTYCGVEPMYKRNVDGDSAANVDLSIDRVHNVVLRRVRLYPVNNATR